MSTTTDEVHFLRLPEVKRVTGLGRDSIYRLIRCNQFPAGRKLSERARGWRSDEVHAWVASRGATVMDIAETPQNRDDEMYAEFLAFDAAYPQVDVLFEKFSFELINKGRTSGSAYSVMHRIRWDTDAGGNGETEFKINDHHIPFYARRFMERHPEHANFFDIREKKSKAKPPRGRPGPKPADLK